MGVRMAGAFARCVALCGAILISGAFALSDEAAPAPVPADQSMPIADPPPYSAQCEVPNSSLAAPEALDDVSADLQRSPHLRILAIGSSSTEGVGASSHVASYPAQLSGIMKRALKGVDVEIVNKGVGGEVAATTAERLRTEVVLEKPDMVLWQLGTNDALARVPPDQFADTVRSTVRWLKENHIDVVLIGLQYTAKLAKDESYFAIRQALKEVASEEKLLYVRRYDAMQFIAQERARLNMVSDDDLHLNDVGYRCMAEQIAHAVIANIFVRRFRPTQR